MSAMVCSLQCNVGSTAVGLLSPGVIAVGAISKSVRDRDESSPQAEACFHFPDDCQLVGAADNLFRRSGCPNLHCEASSLAWLTSSLHNFCSSQPHFPTKRLVVGLEYRETAQSHTVAVNLSNGNFVRGSCRRSRLCIIANVSYHKRRVTLEETPPVCTCRCCISVFTSDITTSSSVSTISLGPPTDFFQLQSTRCTLLHLVRPSSHLSDTHVPRTCFEQAVA